MKDIYKCLLLMFLFISLSCDSDESKKQDKNLSGTWVFDTEESDGELIISLTEGSYILEANSFVIFQGITYTLLNDYSIGSNINALLFDTVEDECSGIEIVFASITHNKFETMRIATQTYNVLDSDCNYNTYHFIYPITLTRL